MDSTQLPLTTWHLTIHLVNQDKTGLSVLALTRYLGASHRTAWLIHQKLMKTMALRDSEQTLAGAVKVDRAYLEDARQIVGGRGWTNEVSIVAPVSTYEQGHPMQVKLGQVTGFTWQAIIA